MLRQKVIVISLLLLVVLIKQSNSIARLSEKEIKLNYYKLLRKLDTGVENPDSKLNQNDLDKFTVNQLNTKINKSYDDLACGYVFSTLHHINLTRLFDVDGEEELKKRDFSFESKLMMATFWQLGLYDRLHEFWSVLVYSTFRPRKGLLYTTSDVYSYLSYFARKHCKSNKNAYNDQNKKSPCYLNLKSITGINIRNKMRESNKRSLKLRISSNAHQMNLTLKTEIFDQNSLYLNMVMNDDNTLNTLLVNYGVFNDSENVLMQLRDDHTNATKEYPLPDIISFLSKFQTRFTLLLEIVMVQIAWKSVLDLSYSYTFETLKILRNQYDNQGTTIKEALREFVNLLNLTKIKFYDTIINIIDKQKFSIASSFLLYQMNELNVMFYSYRPSHIETQNEIPKIDEYVDFIKHKIKDVDFTTFYSFSKFSEIFLKFLEKRSVDESYFESTEDPEYVNYFAPEDDVENISVKVNDNIDNSNEEFVNQFDEVLPRHSNNYANIRNEHPQAHDYMYFEDEEEYTDTKDNIYDSASTFDVGNIPVKVDDSTEDSKKIFDDTNDTYDTYDYTSTEEEGMLQDYFK